MATRSEILTEIRKPRLLRIAESLGLSLSARRTKAALISSMSSCRRYTTLDLLHKLTVDELTKVCASTNRTWEIRRKPELIYALTGDKRILLKPKIISSLRKQGFRTSKGVLLPPSLNDKATVRTLHQSAVEHKREKARTSLLKHEQMLLSRIADGRELDLDAFAPRLVEVHRRTPEELLFRYVSLHWSVPVSSGYGRRLRFLVTDRANDKLVGVIGIGDPVYALSARDDWIGFKKGQQRQRLRNVVDAFVLGAVPPYSYLLGGKLVAMLAASNEVRERFREKYGNRRTVIGENEQDGQIALLTTTSAFGRSSIYNRIRFQDRPMYIPVGYTRGYGDFQFLNGLYDELFSYAKDMFTPTAKQDNWGSGFRNRREVVKKWLMSAGLSEQLLRHGVKRQVYVVPMAHNTAAYLRGDDDQLDLFDQSVEELFHHFKARWLLPRADRLIEARNFCSSDYIIWGNS